MSTVAVIGCGMVGATTAMRIGEARLADRIVLVDNAAGVADAMALDIGQALPATGSDTRVTTGWDAPTPPMSW
jgi:malate/lactate dehydrogenase